MLSRSNQIVTRSDQNGVESSIKGGSADFVSFSLSMRVLARAYSVDITNGDKPVEMSSSCRQRVLIIVMNGMCNVLGIRFAVFFRLVSKLGSVSRLSYSYGKWFCRAFWWG